MNNWNTYVRFSFNCIKTNSDDQVEIDEFEPLTGDRYFIWISELLLCFFIGQTTKTQLRTGMWTCHSWCHTGFK